MKLTLERLRRFAISSSLGRPTTLKHAIARLGFVQADPIRSPERAQDLILRHRVKGYRAGDLDTNYGSLGIEEDFLYAYGFMLRETSTLLHPRTAKRLSAAEKKLLAIVAGEGKVHPRDLEQHLGRERELNPWGGYSKSTTRSLQALHYRGLLRIAGREKGIRLYEADEREQEILAPEERLRRLVLLIAKILAPLPERSLRATLRLLKYGAPSLEGSRPAVKRLLASGDLESAEVEGVRYLWPTGMVMRGSADAQVRFLAPFDPIVWDRARFEHFWGWPYRFEAYTPSAKRTMGYYAMPLLWGERIIGWVNVAKRGGALKVEAGFRGGMPDEASFRNKFDAEVESFREFVSL